MCTFANSLFMAAWSFLMMTLCVLKKAALEGTFTALYTMIKADCVVKVKYLVPSKHVEVSL